MAGFDAYEQRFVRVESDIAELRRDVAVVRQDMGDVRRDVFLLKWMMGFVLAFQVAIFAKMFLH